MDLQFMTYVRVDDSGTQSGQVARVRVSRQCIVFRGKTGSGRSKCVQFLESQSLDEGSKQEESGF